MTKPKKTQKGLHTGLGIGKGNSLGAVCTREHCWKMWSAERPVCCWEWRKILFSPSSCTSHQILLAKEALAKALGPIRQNRTDKTEQKLPPSDKGPHWLFSSSLHLATWPAGPSCRCNAILPGQSPNLKACLLYRIVSWSSYNCPFRGSLKVRWCRAGSVTPRVSDAQNRNTCGLRLSVAKA